MSTETDDSEMFKELYEKHKEATDRIAASDNPAAPIAQAIKERATEGDDD